MTNALGNPHRSLEDWFLAELPLIERVIAAVARRQGASSDEAEEFESHVKLKFVEDGYAVLRKFQGRSNLKTYLTTTIHHLFLDFRNSRWGKWRPSAEARRLGPVGMLLEQYLARDGYAFDEACEQILTTRQLATTRQALEEMAARLPPRTRRRFEPVESVAEGEVAQAPPDDAGEADDRQRIARKVSNVVSQVVQGLEAQDRLVLAMHYEDGRTVAEIARTLRLDQKALYRRLDGLLGLLRAGLQEAGLFGSTVREVLDHRGLLLDWGTLAPPKTQTAGPSEGTEVPGWP